VEPPSAWELVDLITLKVRHGERLSLGVGAVKLALARMTRRTVADCLRCWYSSMRNSELQAQSNLYEGTSRERGLKLVKQVMTRRVKGVVASCVQVWHMRMIDAASARAQRGERAANEEIGFLENALEDAVKAMEERMLLFYHQ
jgi:hypothetical protein